MNTPTESAAQESELVSQTAMHALAVVEHCLVVPEQKRDDAEFLRASVINAAAWLKDVRTEMDRLASAPQPPITKDASAPAQDGVEVIADKIITEYKEHYDFPSQGESHMHDCITTVLEAFPPPQPTPPAQPVIGKLFARECTAESGAPLLKKLWEVVIDEFFDTEAEALTFIESCKPETAK